MLVARKEADGYAFKFEEKARTHTENETLCNLINYGKRNRDVMSLNFE